jgi:hypothetical protein
MLKKYVFYIIRWQCSTPILALCMYYLNFDITTKTVIANFIGALIFFWVDKFIFKNNVYFPLWEIQEEIKCVDCGQVSKGFRLVKTKNYDKIQDKNPEFRCEKCSQNKLQKLKERGIKY